MHNFVNVLNATARYTSRGRNVTCMLRRFYCNFLKVYFHKFSKTFKIKLKKEMTRTEIRISEAEPRRQSLVKASRGILRQKSGAEPTGSCSPRCRSHLMETAVTVQGALRQPAGRACRPSPFLHPSGGSELACAPSGHEALTGAARRWSPRPGPVSPVAS